MTPFVKSALIFKGFYKSPSKVLRQWREQRTKDAPGSDGQLPAGEEGEAEAQGQLSRCLQQPLRSLCWHLGCSALSRPEKAGSSRVPIVTGDKRSLEAVRRNVALPDCAKRQ